MKAMLRQEWEDKRSALTQRHTAERDAMKREHGRLASRVLRIIDVTGRTRRNQDAERKEMQERQKADRQAVVADHRAGKVERRTSLEQRYGLMHRELRAAHAPGLDRLRDRHQDADRKADRERQIRAADREVVAQRTEQAISKVERRHEASGRSTERGRSFSPER